MNGDSDSSRKHEAVLKIKTDGLNRRFVLAADELVTIGRAAACGIQVQDKSVSREHCVAVFTKGKICINDLRSTHGVTFQGERVDRCELWPGDSCNLGSALATFEPAATHKPAKVVSAPKPAQRPATPLPATPLHEAVQASSDAAASDEFAAAKTMKAKPALDQAADAIAGYRILEKIGEGGFANVYRAEQVQLRREVALKILKRDDDDDDEHKQRIEEFMSEARVAAGLSDPRLVQIYDVGESGGEHFLSMELVEGGSLARKLRRDGAMPWQEVIRLLRDVGNALNVAHSAGLVHRDVKPGNILMTSSGQAKLTDLGLAVNESHAGTIAFMAPEQLRREPLDGRTDLYGLGCTAYAALSGSAPFAGDRQEMARAHLKQKPAPLLDRNVQVPWHLHQLIIDSMMAKNPNDRPQDASAMIARLDRMILPTNAEPVGLDEDELDYPSVAPIRSSRSRATGSQNQSSKAFWARLAGDAIVFSICAATTIGLLLALRVVWPGADIYKMIGK